MANSFKFIAESREDIGKGASRRLRREDKIPAVVYGGNIAPQAITIAKKDIAKALNEETFYSQLIDIEINGEVQETILRDLQRHPYKPSVLHADFQRVVRGQELTVSVPLHYMNAESSVGVKSSGILSQNVIDVEVICRPSLIPESIEVDVIALDVNDTLHLSDLVLPEGVRLVAFENGQTDDNNAVIVSIHAPKAEKVVEATVEADSAAGSAD